MSDFDPKALPQAIKAYFTIDDRRQVLPLFAADAWVRDEGETHKGTEAIRIWLDDVEQRYQPRQTVRAVSNEDDHIIVTFDVSGNFPGSPVTLRQVFTLGPDDKIASLTTL